MTDPRSELIESREAARALIERSRVLFAAHGDERGVHLCEIALARVASDPREALAALLPPIERLAATRTLTGLDIIASEAIVAARALGAQGLEARVRGLVAATGSPDLRARVFVALWDRVEVLVESGDVGGGRNAAWAALDLAVVLDDFLAAAVSLVWLAGCHEAAWAREGLPADAAAASLCLEQAARYLARSGRPLDAGNLFLDVARQQAAVHDAWPPSPKPRTAALLEEAIRAYEEAGARDRLAECRLEVARGHLESGRPREAIRALQKALSGLEGPETLGLEVQAWRLLAEAHHRLDDPESASAAEARARLLEEAFETAS